MNIMNLKFWIYLAIGATVAAVVMPLVLEGQETDVGVKDVSPAVVLDVGGKVAQFTIEEKMSVKDKQAEYRRLQAQAASILLQASNLQMELTNEVMRLQVRCVESGGKFDPGTVNCLIEQEIQAQEGK